MLIGYDWNDGGINNQKLALLGLFRQARESSHRNLYLPKIYSKDQHDKNSTVLPLADVFEINLIQDFAARWEINILDEPTEVEYADRIARAGWDYFGQGAGAVGEATQDVASAYASIASDFFRSLVPKTRHTPITHYLMGEVFGRLGIDTVVQLRIEEDWYIHSRQHLSQVVKEEEDYYITAPEIIGKVKMTFPDLKRAYVSCDERYIFAPKQVITQEVLSATGVEIVWKSDILSVSEFESLPPVTTSLMDFEIAKVAERFVGMSRSTFANLATFERFSAAYRDRGGDFIYNLPGNKVCRRIDGGGQDNPRRACGV